MLNNWLHNKPRIFFMHVPKTGGTSVNSAIRKHYGRQFYCIDPIQTRTMAKLLYKSVPCVDKGTYLLRDGFILDAMTRNIPYVSGHTHFNQDIWQRYSDKYAYITLLRDPVKRYISAYFFDSNPKSGGSYTDLNLSDLIETDRGIRLGHFYLNYFAGFPLKKNYDFNNLSERIEMAKENILKFDLVGFLEDLEHFKAQFKKQFGLNLRIPHKNKSSVSKPQIDSHCLEKIREICQPDREIYEFIKSDRLNKTAFS